MNPAPERTAPPAQADARMNETSTPTKHQPLGTSALAPHPVSATVTLLPLQPEDELARSREWSLTATAGAGPNARLRARPLLTVWRWTGDVEAAARVADKLVDNAFRHGQPFPDGSIRLRFILLSNTDELMIEVSDADSEFPACAQAVTAAPALQKAPNGLWWVRHYQGRLSWDVRRDDQGHVVGKTVQAIIPVTWEASA